MNAMHKLSLGLSAVTLLGLAALPSHAATTLSATNGGGVVKTKTDNIGSYTYVTGNGAGGGQRYSVFDFTPTAAPGVTGVTSFGVSLFDEGYTSSDSVSGGISFYVEPDITTNIDGGGPLTFDTANATGVDVGTANGFTQAPILVGSGTLTAPAATVPNYAYSFNFTPSAALSTYLAGQLDTGGRIRLLATPSSNTDAIDADIFGYASTSGGNAPTISLATSSGTSAPPQGGAAVPEASAYALLGLGLLPLGLLARRRIAA